MKFDGWQIPLATIAGVSAISACLNTTAKSEVIAAWVQALGSVVAILAAVGVAYSQFEQTRKLEIDRAAAEEAKDMAETRAFVQAVRQELTVIWDGYADKIRPLLHAVPENDFFNGLVPVDGHIFTIYNNASPRVGKVDDEELRGLIVKTYARAKGFVYSLQMNNAMVSEISNLVLAQRDDVVQKMMDHRTGVLVAYAAQLKKDDEELEGLLRALTAKANEWLRS
ncbi:hypothetical protein [Paraburkholderia sp. BCC1884]|uniref:hypothetical protein n=1 Tax=Paraburkholderia sp. BCC1884 TaxID=2562668 RepID=UPI0011832ADD|nr:hypothetical protein [Paraburkholderia sp. BCC1884]